MFSSAGIAAPTLRLWNTRTWKLLRSALPVLQLSGKVSFFVVVDRFDLKTLFDRATKDMAFPYVISSTLGYENQPEVLKLFRRSSSRPNTRSVELKCPSEQETRRKSMLHLDSALDPTSPHPIVNSTEDTEASAVARA